jgi:hypothetical protein
MHKNKVFLTMGLMERIKINKWINTRFIGLLCVAFFLQHFSYATLQNSFGFKTLSSGVTQNNYFEKQTSELPDTQVNVFVDAESEDEDDIHNEQDVSNDLISYNQIFKAERYTDVVNTLYLKLASTNQQKVDLPFFILYHSWKSDLV